MTLPLVRPLAAGTALKGRSAAWVRVIRLPPGSGTVTTRWIPRRVPLGTVEAALPTQPRSPSARIECGCGGAHGRLRRG